MKKFELVKPEDDKKFETLYNGFIIGGSIVNSKGLIILRRELSILDKLEKISKDCECGKKILNDEVQRELVGGSVELTDQEHELLCNYVAAVPWTTGKSVREALAVIDWLAAL